MRAHKRLHGLAWRQDRQAGLRRHRAHGFEVAERFADDAAGKRRRRPVRCTRPHHNGWQPHGASIHKAFARVVTDEQLADGFLGAVRRLRRLRRGVIDHVRQRTAEAGDRTGEDQPWWARQGAAGFEHGQGAVQVDTHTEVKIGFSRRAHHRGEVEDTGCTLIDDLGERGTIGNVPRGHLQACVSADGRLGPDGVQHHDRLNGLLSPTGAHELASLQQGTCQTPPQKPGTAGDDDFHRTPRIRKPLASTR